MMEHTKGPWKVKDERTIFGQNGLTVICDTAQPLHGPGKYEAMANAEFIARACNAHEECW